MESCGTCGARLAAGSGWCGQCLSPAPPAPEEVPAMHPGPASARPWLPPEPPVVPEYSRWKAGPTSFGPRGRIALTALVLLGGFLGYGMVADPLRHPIARAFGFVYLAVLVVAVVLLLRWVWRRDRVR